MVDVGLRVEQIDAVDRARCPSDGSSSRLRQRSSVDLPEPDGPITNTSSRSASSEIDALQDMKGAEMLVEAARLDD